MKTFAGAVLSALLVAVVASCAQTRSIKTPIFEDRRTGVVLYGRVDQSNVPVAMSYAHPFEFKLDDLKYLLASISFQEKKLLGWSDIMRVFTADELYRMTPHLVAAFAQADSSQEAQFQLRTAKPGSLFYFERFTNGTMFVKDGKLNCAFANLDARSESDLYEGNPRKYYAGGLWTLVVKEGQALVEDEGGVHNNWIQLDIESGLAQKRQVDEAIKKRQRSRRRPPAEKQPQPQEPENWQDWSEDAVIQEEQPLPDVYFPDELPVIKGN
jgi:hypothetical protein